MGFVSEDILASQKQFSSISDRQRRERRQVMCVGARSGSKLGPLDTEPSALTNFAICPVLAIQTLLEEPKDS